MKRKDGRGNDQLRPMSFVTGFAPHSTGSVLIAAGNTRVICSAMIEDGVPRWMKDQRVAGGWITAEYSMLPYSTTPRKARDISKGRIDGRSTEIQRLIGRALRAVVDLDLLGARTIWVDCDVLQADGGTRTAAITGASVAVALACRALVTANILAQSPFKSFVAAISAGVVDGDIMVDLDYEEDKAASVDLNIVLNAELEFVEIQGAGEEATFSAGALVAMLDMGKKAVAELIGRQVSLLNDPAPTNEIKLPSACSSL